MRMKIFAMAWLACFVSVGISLAAQMGTPAYDSYVTTSIDGNNIVYQTVVVEGTTTGYVPPQCQYQCGQYKWCTNSGLALLGTRPIYTMCSTIAGDHSKCRR